MTLKKACGMCAMGMGKIIPLVKSPRISRASPADEIDSENGQCAFFVQANVERPDLGGFVERSAVAHRAGNSQLPPAMTIEWSGQYENQSARQRTFGNHSCDGVFIIFLLLYIVYHSLKEAAHVILAVPFALTGGCFLQWFGYNFSVAVLGRLHALLERQFKPAWYGGVFAGSRRKKNARLGNAFRNQILQAVKDGAGLRLRPIVMTVATIVASLLPILWSNRAARKYEAAGRADQSAGW